MGCDHSYTLDGQLSISRMSINKRGISSLSRRNRNSGCLRENAPGCCEYEKTFRATATTSDQSDATVTTTTKARVT